MNVTSAILNRSARTNMESGQKTNRQMSELWVDPAMAPWAAGLPTPSPERTSPRISADSRNITKSRTPWDAGGYSLPLSMDPKFFPSKTGPVIYGGDPLDSISARSAITPLSSHSRTTSLELSPEEMPPSALAASTTSRTLKSNYFGEPECQLEVSVQQRGSIDSDVNTQLTATRPSFLDGHSPISPVGSPTSSRHKFSDSHSSFSSYATSSYAPSSYAPSCQSGGHSRMSSFSTVGMAQSSNVSGLAEIPYINENVDSHGPANWTPAPVFGGSRPPSPGLGRISSGLPFRFGGFNGDRPRQRSPSDAFVGRRSNRPSLDRGYLLSQPLENVHEDPYQDKLHPLLNIRQTCSSSNRKHKRAISAPIFPHPFQPSHPHLAYNNRFHALPDSIRSTFRKPVYPIMTSERDDSQEPGGGNRSPTTHPGPTAPATTAGPSRREANLHIPCEKDAECNTGTDRRKVISHFFGRNKKCTRSVPEQVWVHWCRKHYQRERYQQGSDFSKVQAALLLTQMERINEWSDQNRSNGQTGGIVQDWELRLRKRAEDRQSRNSAAAARAEDDVEATPQTAGQPVVHPGAQSDGTTPVPQWLMDEVGEGHSAEHMMATMRRLHDEICSGHVVGMPDIEILPNIVSEQPRRPQKQRTRAPVAHRRTQSQGIPQAAVAATPPLAPATSGSSNLSTSSNSSTRSSLDMRTSEEMMPQSQSRRVQQAADETPPQRTEKRKAEESLEASMSPPNTRRALIPYRPSANSHAHRESVEQQQPAEHPAPSRHSRSRSDIPYPHRYGHRIGESRDSTGRPLSPLSIAYGPRNTRSVSYTSYLQTSSAYGPWFEPVLNLANGEYVPMNPYPLELYPPAPVDDEPRPPPRPDMPPLGTPSYERIRNDAPSQPVQPRIELPALRPRSEQQVRVEAPTELPPIRQLIAEVGVFPSSALRSTASPPAATETPSLPNVAQEPEPHMPPYPNEQPTRRRRNRYGGANPARRPFWYEYNGGNSNNRPAP